MVQKGLYFSPFFKPCLEYFGSLTKSQICSSQICLTIGNVYLYYLLYCLRALGHLLVLADSTGAPHCTARAMGQLTVLPESNGAPPHTSRELWSTSMYCHIALEHLPVLPEQLGIELYCQRALGQLTVLPENTEAPHCTTREH